MNFNTLTLEQVTARINDIKKGQFFKVTAFSTPKTTDKSIIYKVTDYVCRTKIDRTHKACYVEPTYHRNEDSEYLIENALKHNNTTNNTLFCINPVWHSCKSKFYDELMNEISEAEAKSHIKQRTASTIPDFITINANNIINLIEVSAE